MRNIRQRRRVRFALIILLVLCFILFIESRIDAFMPDVRNFAEAKAGEIFDGKVKFSIGDIDGGIIRPFVFRHVTISGVESPGPLSSLVIDSIRTNYRIWDALTKKYAVFSSLSGNPVIYISFSMKDKDMSGLVRLEGDIKNSDIAGYVELPGRQRVEFDGKIKGRAFESEIISSLGTLRARGIAAQDGIKVNFDARHIKIGSYDIVCEGILTGVSKDGGVEGEFTAKNLILNYKPFLDLKSSYRISGGILEIRELAMGDSFQLRGKAALKSPYAVDAVLTANNVNLGWLLPALGALNATSILTGTMNGKFEFKGPVEDLKSNTHLEIRKGTMATLDFSYLSANIKGEGPVLKIEDSRITRESGYFVLAGEMDLKRMGKENFFNDIKLVSDDTAIAWDSWHSAKRFDVEEVSMKKKINDDLNLDFKTFTAAEKVDESLREKDSVGVEYKLSPQESLKMVVGQQEEKFLGLEHKDRF